MTVSTSTIANTLKLTLSKICDDTTDGIESSMLMPKWIDDVSNMEDAYEDDLEVGGPGLAPEKAEGAEIAFGSITEGYLTRYVARTYALRLVVTDEAMEDSKYPQAIKAARRLKRSLYKTADYLATNILIRGFNTSYVGGDGVCLFSASHTLPSGSTFSNVLSTPASPSVAAVTTMTSAIRKLPGHDGLIEGYEPKMVVCPTDQWATWSAIVNSNFTPQAGNFAEINVVKNDLSLKVVPIKYWNNTTTNWAMITDCDNGLKFKWKRKVTGKSWVANDNETVHYAASMRLAYGWSDPRCAYGSSI